MDKISENEERKIEDRLLAIESAVEGISKALKRHSNAIYLMQTFVFLQNCDDHEMMKILLKLFADESPTKQFSKILGEV